MEHLADDPMLPPPVMACSSCFENIDNEKGLLADGKFFQCWWCKGALCFSCASQNNGHCGHWEATEIDRQCVLWLPHKLAKVQEVIFEQGYEREPGEEG